MRITTTTRTVAILPATTIRVHDQSRHDQDTLPPLERNMVITKTLVWRIAEGKESAGNSESDSRGLSRTKSIPQRYTNVEVKVGVR